MVPGRVSGENGHEAGGEAWHGRVSSQIGGHVVVDGVPARLFLESQDHQQDLIREFVLIQFGHRFDVTTTEVPQRLARLIADIHSHYADVRGATRQQALEALDRGQEIVSMAVPVLPGMAGALRQWLELLEQADRWCQEGTMLTLAAPPEVRRLRRWYAGELLRLLPAEAPEPSSPA